MANVKFIAVSRGLRGIVDYVTNREKTVEQLISGVNWPFVKSKCTKKQK